MEKELSMDDINFNLPKRGEKIKGVVVQVDDRTIMVDFNSVTEGTLHLNHYTLDKNVSSFKGLVKVGDEIEAVVESVVENEYGTRIMLSRLGDAKKEAFNDLIQDTKEPITVTVSERVKAGYKVNYKGINFFLHESEADNLHKGDKVKVLVVSVDNERNTGKVSIKALEKYEENKEKAQTFESLKVGDVIEGPVSRIEPYGIFIQIKNLFGLVRLKELDHVYIENPTSKFKVGDVYKAKIISLDGGKINLSFKALTKSPIEQYASEHKVSDKVTVKAIQKLPFGVVCELAPNVTGLLHKSEFSWNPNDNLLASIKIGDELEVAIIEINVEKNKVALSRKALIDNPWERVDAKVGDVIDCKVTEVTPKGLKFEALGVDGFVDIRDIKLENGSSKLTDYYNVSDEFKAIITKVDPKAWILNASIKKLQEANERADFEKYMQEEKSEDVEMTIGDALKK